jgi:hemerythrin
MFRSKVAEFLADHRAGKAGVPASLLLFMQDWLEKHVLNTDKQYGAFLNARGVH